MIPLTANLHPVASACNAPVKFSVHGVLATEGGSSRRPENPKDKIPISGRVLFGATRLTWSKNSLIALDKGQKAMGHPPRFVPWSCSGLRGHLSIFRLWKRIDTANLDGPCFRIQGAGEFHFLSSISFSQLLVIQ